MLKFAHPNHKLVPTMWVQARELRRRACKGTRLPQRCTSSFTLPIRHDLQPVCVREFQPLMCLLLAKTNKPPFTLREKIKGDVLLRRKRFVLGVVLFAVPNPNVILNLAFALCACGVGERQEDRARCGQTLTSATRADRQNLQNLRYVGTAGMTALRKQSHKLAKRSCLFVPRLPADAFAGGTSSADGRSA